MNSRFRKRRYGIGGAICTIIGVVLYHLIVHWAGASPQNAAFVLCGVFAVVLIALMFTKWGDSTPS
jgi:high-affinity Fe2+/Pb2+ permease